MNGEMNGNNFNNNNTGGNGGGFNISNLFDSINSLFLVL